MILPLRVSRTYDWGSKMVSSVPWARNTGLAVLILVAFFTIFFGQDFYTAQQLPNDALAGSVLRCRQDLNFFAASFNSSDDPVLRAPNVRPIKSATDDDYNRANDKGTLLKCWMKDPSAAGALGSSRWNDYDDLKDWGWIETTTTTHGGENRPGFSDIVGPFGGDDWSNENKIGKFEHKGQHPDQEVTQPDGSRGTVSYPVGVSPGNRRR